MINTVTTEPVNFYQIHWLKEDGEQGKFSSPEKMTASELSEYLEHLFYERQFYKESEGWEVLTFTALPISEEAYNEEMSKIKDIASDEIYGHICNQIEDIIGENIIEIFGFLDQHSVYFSCWNEVWKANKDDIEIFSDVLYIIPVEGEFYFRHQGLCGHYFYSELLDSPSWLEICLYTELGIRNTCDTDHVFIEGLQNSGETKDGYPVYECVLDRM